MVKRNTGLGIVISLLLLLMTVTEGWSSPKITRLDVEGTDTLRVIGSPTIERPYDTILTYYDKLYDDILTRNPDSLSSYLQHSVSAVQKQAWRAMASTPVDDIYGLEIEVEDADISQAWFALSMHEIESELIRILEDRWEAGRFDRDGLSMVLGRQGDSSTLEFLLNNLNEVHGTDNEYAAALAIGRLSMNGDYDITKSDQFQLIRSAFTAKDIQITRAYLYGAYRSDKSVLDDEVKQNLYKLWRFYGIGNTPEIDQYMIRILGKSVPNVVMNAYSGRQPDRLDPRVGIELARLINYGDIDSGIERLTRNLLQHENHQVKIVTLKSLRKESALTDSLYHTLRDSLLEREEINDMVWTQSLLTASLYRDTLVKHYESRFDSLRSRNPYLTPLMLQLVQSVQSKRTYLATVDSLVEEGHSLKATFAVRSLANFWEEELKPGEKKGDPGLWVRNIIMNALLIGDRGVAYHLNPLLKDPILVKDNEYGVLKQALSPFRLPADIEVYQAFAEVLWERFSERAKPLVDSLASYQYAPLNQTLQTIGWDVPPVEGHTPDFREPDWQRLQELGSQPVWRLHLSHDTVDIQLNPVIAPATVSAIDSLTRAGVYDSVAIHRVVPNFVVQGGDFERGDGFGGPSFVLPTEASELPFDRGTVGIASAGTDTEGSQYFIMHQWKPHLNGNYTRFGRVIDGMDAVDGITEGDRVIRAEIVE